MSIDRRTLLAVFPAVIAGAGVARAEDAGPVLQALEQSVGGRIGVYAENIATGAKLERRADERFHMCSSFKASLVACVLARIDRGEDRLDAPVAYGPKDILSYAPVAKAGLAKGELSVGEMCQGAVELSDSSCANLLMARIGGPPALTAFWRATGDAITRQDHYEPVNTQAGSDEDTTTPAAMAGSLRRFLLGDVLSPASRERLTGWMRDCKTGLDLLRSGLPKGWTVGDKTGNDGKAMLVDIAIAWPEPGKPLLITAYIDGDPAASRRVRRLMADIGSLVGQQLV
jgi:beta-lactamase class A